jgi:hypothetical protein
MPIAGSSRKVVGATGFEPAASRSRTAEAMASPEVTLLLGHKIPVGQNCTGVLFSTSIAVTLWVTLTATMSDEHDNESARVRAEELVADSDHVGGDVSSGVRRILVNALTKDLSAADKATGDEARLVKLETQTHVLAEAVIAITDTPATLAPAVQAVKDEM